tara:strand:- start:170 stop:313 length:144 start_codon:yes stop_codon:yes gene_type:complete
MLKKFIDELKELINKYWLIAKARWAAFEGSVKASVRSIKNKAKDLLR